MVRNPESGGEGENKGQGGWGSGAQSKKLYSALKREVGKAILNTKGKAVLPLFSVCNKYMGVY